ncbi:hypothetical protein GE21DRAFT_1229073 [Neurospora crassa]|nr:hypothetical protein GE21DRAFT_1229073 [Neurospora crassa]
MARLFHLNPSFTSTPEIHAIRLSIDRSFSQIPRLLELSPCPASSKSSVFLHSLLKSHRRRSIWDKPSARETLPYRKPTKTSTTSRGQSRWPCLMPRNVGKELPARKRQRVICFWVGHDIPPPVVMHITVGIMISQPKHLPAMALMTMRSLKSGSEHLRLSLSWQHWSRKTLCNSGYLSNTHSIIIILLSVSL